MTGGIHRFYAVVHPIDAKIFTSKSRTVKVIASTWLVAVVLALPYLYCKSYAFSIESHLGSASRFICTDRFDEIDAMVYSWQKSTSVHDDDDDQGTEILQSPSTLMRGREALLVNYWHCPHGMRSGVHVTVQ